MKDPKQEWNLERIAFYAIRWIGSINSILIHTALFMLSFLLVIFGVNVDRVLLVLTTVVSLEAIYLAIFIQMTVNRNTARLREVSRDIDEIQEDIEEISEDIEEISEDVDEIQEDIEEMEEENDQEVKQKINTKNPDKNNVEILERIETTLSQLKKEIETIKNSTK